VLAETFWGAPLVVVGVLVLAFVVWGVVDAARIDESAWAAAGQSKIVWILFMAIGFIACGLIGVFATVIYFATIRPRVKAAG
jgi:hypothetical protein